MSRKYTVLSILIFLVIITAALIISRTEIFRDEEMQTGPDPGQVQTGKKLKVEAYVGREACVKCHKREVQLWAGSHHDLAMAVAHDSTVLGDFNSAEFTHFGITSRFYKKNNRFFVSTEGPEGKIEEFQVSYTFGVVPLQQYLVKFPDGRLQVLPLCWDTRPEEQGGQKWFHIYPDERIDHKDVLYWTRLNQNWNFMCSECHSTHVKKNYDLANNTFNTTFSEIDVSCESCHGPGADHIQWAEAYQQMPRSPTAGDMGLKIRLKETGKGTWIFKPDAGTAERSTPLKSGILVEMCARCHARRLSFTDQYLPGLPLMQTHRPTLLEEDMYFADGQILEEVYVYGSYLQSKMYHAGVICTDCHEPHSMKVYAQDNTLCYRCHRYDKYGIKTHHFHNPDSSGASCVECHMPERTYMVIDPRRDHSIRIPRPDLTEQTGAPNACNKCHSNKSSDWSTRYVTQWYGSDFSHKPHYGKTFARVRSGLPKAQSDLLALIWDVNLPEIVRASAILELRRYANNQTAQALTDLIIHPDPLIRFATVQVSSVVDPAIRWRLLTPVLDDSLRLIRMEAAALLSETPENVLSNRERSLLSKALEEYRAGQVFNGDRPSSHLNLGILYLRQRNFDEAEKAYKKAIDLEPGIPYTYINLADLYRMQARDAQGEKILQQGIGYLGDNAALYQALGLLYIRQKRKNEAMSALNRSYEIAPNEPNYSYTYALALNSDGKAQEAIKLLEEVYDSAPYDQRILQALATLSRDVGNTTKAQFYAQKLVEYFPENQGYQQLLQSLMRRVTP